MPQTGIILNEKTVSKPDSNVKKQLVNEKKDSVKAEQIKAWNISGALAARGNGKSVSASFNWHQAGAANYKIHLFGPLGSGSVIIDRHAGMTSYSDGPKKDTDPNAERLFKRQTGVDLPVDRLYYWIRGLAAPGAIQSAQRDAQGSLQSFQQDGYHVTCLNYMESHGLRLPGKVQIQGPNVVIKVVIKGWRV
jgi:outer membrane lipoprotein LolB